MNALELADCIEFDAPIVGINKEAATMLRQQQAEIEALKAKTLTDMEILEMANKFKNLEWAIVAFARAILRKAQEK